jgi:hypothetical protein
MEKFTLNITGPDFCLTLDDLPLAVGVALTGCYTPGCDALEDVQAFLSTVTVTCDPDTAKAMLRPYGAWDEEELEDHTTNLEKLVWLIGCDLAENGESYLSTY